MTQVPVQVKLLLSLLYSRAALDLIGRCADEGRPVTPSSQAKPRLHSPIGRDKTASSKLHQPASKQARLAKLI
ncbi:hypothetical protein BKA65DRAFT_516332 [Rhexocercosporidium sp. MPI-PUGE-AT-0058]|nr:hypothetical protein BKA65DRAFT_516332 [Rhexocercosporidium sp. MPI-PUGE-AT-0058]